MTMSVTPLAESLLGAGRALVAIAVRTIGEGPVDVTVVQHRVLLLLEAHETLTVNAIAVALGVDQSNASRHCLRLEALGLVTRARAKRDRRVIEVRLTMVGHHQVRAVRDARLAMIAAVLERIGDTEAQAVVAALERFDEAAAELTEEPSVPPL